MERTGWSSWHTNKTQPEDGDYVQIIYYKYRDRQTVLMEGFFTKSTRRNKWTVIPRTQYQGPGYVKRWRKHLPPEEPKRVERKTERPIKVDGVTELLV